MKASKKFLALLFTVVLTTGMLLTGCAIPGLNNNKSTASTSGGTVKAFFSGPQPDEFKGLLMEALQEAAPNQGVTLDFGNACETVNDQVAQIRAAKDNYDVIICLPLDKDTALQLETAAGDKPVVFVNSTPEDTYLKADKYMAVCSYEYDAGEYQAEYVWNKLGQPSSLNIVILRGELTHNASVGRSVAVKHWFQDHGVDANVVFDDTANWDTAEATKVFNTFLSTRQPFDAVFCNNDGMALGVVHSMKSHGYDLSKIPVVGVDATAGGCEAIQKGEMQFTAFQSAAGQGQKAIEVVKALATKGTASGIDGRTDDGLMVLVPFEKVDASNVKDYM